MLGWVNFGRRLPPKVGHYCMPININWLPLSVLKISGWPKQARALFERTHAESASMVSDKRQDRTLRLNVNGNAKVCQLRELKSVPIPVREDLNRWKRKCENHLLSG